MKSLFRREGSCLIALVLLPLTVLITHTLVCVPIAHAESVLEADDCTLLHVPSSSFAHELDRLGIPASHHQSASHHRENETDLQLELRDLLKTKAAQGLSAAARATLIQQLTEVRATGSIDGHSEIPHEFLDYIQGARAWHSKNVATARQCWKKLLERPAAERAFKTTWATYMLGRAGGTNEWQEAIAHFRDVRRLAEQGFSDSIGLAAASYGEEARIQLNRGEYSQALQLYLQQYTTGDDFASPSIEITIRKALSEANPVKLRALAENPLWRHAVGGWLVANRENEAHGDDAGPFDRLQRLQRWITAVETLKTNDVASVEHIVLAAFQRGQQELSRQWIRRAPSAPICQWMTAKLWLRAGNLLKASQILQRIQYAFPIESVSASTNRPHTLEAGLEMRDRSAGQRIRGELGALKLGLRDYTASLESLLSGNYWCDAAYVAERLLTLNELKAYVDVNWPEPEWVSPNAPGSSEKGYESEHEELRKKLRELLGRRLVRNNRGHEAFDYLPEAEHRSLFTLFNAMVQGANESLAKSERAQNWWTAAQIARQRGMELMGTELEPDWTITGGNGSRGITREERASTNNLVRASVDELRRAEQQGPVCEDRFHYRYVAAAMAWRATKMMPNNDPNTAVILCTAGSWLKRHDAVAADYFYKALVRRCRRTEIGEQAEARRWFPTLDATGQLEPWHGSERSTSPEPDTDTDESSLIDGIMLPEQLMSSDEPLGEEENESSDAEGGGESSEEPIEEERSGGAEQAAIIDSERLRR